MSDVFDQLLPNEWADCNYLERCFGVMFVDDAEGADIGAGSADLGCDIDDELIFVDQAMISAALRHQIQTRDCNDSLTINSCYSNQITPASLPLPKKEKN